MKKLLVILLSVLMIMGLMGCSSKEETKEPVDEPKPVEVDEKDDNTGDTTNVTEQDVENFLNNFELGVREDGDKVIWSIGSNIEGFDIVADVVFTFVDGAVAKASAVYHCPNKELTDAIVNELKSQTDIVQDSIKVSGNDVTCDMIDSYIEDFQGIDKETLMMVLSYTATE